MCFLLLLKHGENSSVYNFISKAILLIPENHKIEVKTHWRVSSHANHSIHSDRYLSIKRHRLNNSLRLPVCDFFGFSVALNVIVIIITGGVSYRISIRMYTSGKEQWAWYGTEERSGEQNTHTFPFDCLEWWLLIVVKLFYFEFAIEHLPCWKKETRFFQSRTLKLFDIPPSVKLTYFILWLYQSLFELVLDFRKATFSW